MEDKIREVARQEWIDAALQQKALIEVQYKQKTQNALPFIRIICTGIWIGALIGMPIPLDPWKYVRLSVLALMGWFVVEESWLMGRAFFLAMVEIYFQDHLEKDADEYANSINDSLNKLKRLDNN